MNVFRLYILLSIGYFLFFILQGQIEVFSSQLKMMITMIFGAFIAGSTSEGGGAVAFPVMTLVFKMNPMIARDFSLAIQSFGMSAASLAIIFKKIQFEKKVIFLNIIGRLIGLIIAFQTDKFINPKILKLVYVSFWLSFAYVLIKIYLEKNRPFEKKLPQLKKQEKLIFIFAGLFGGIISGYTGNGIDIINFSILTLYFRLDPKVATSTSVILMGMTSVIGMVLKNVGFFSLNNQVFPMLKACIPVVIIVAPLGAIFISKKGSDFITKLLLSILLIQFLGAILIIRPTLMEYGYMLISFLIGLSIYLFLFRNNKLEIEKTNS